MPRGKQAVKQKTTLSLKISLGASSLAILAALAMIGTQIGSVKNKTGNNSVSVARITGMGTLVSPYIITNCTQLQMMREKIFAHYKLGNNIDCSETRTWNGGAGFDPVGKDIASTATTEVFTGSLNGNNKIISNLYINRPEESIVGLFSGIASVDGDENSGKIYSLILKDADISGGNGSAGVVAGYQSSGEISKVCVSGKIKAEGHAGGIVGYQWRSLDESRYNVSINNSCAFDIDINAAVVGGLVGTQEGSITNSYAKGHIKSRGLGVAGAGGISGSFRYFFSSDDTNTRILNSYAMVSIETENKERTGGLVGSSRSEVLTPDDRISNSFYDSDFSGWYDTGHGEPRTSAQMKIQATYIGWDFSTVWAIDPAINDGYPYLRNVMVRI